jgi:hypothetical protein
MIAFVVYNVLCPHCYDKKRIKSVYAIHVGFSRL